MNRVVISRTCEFEREAWTGLYENDVVCRAAFGKIFSQGGDYDRHGQNDCAFGTLASALVLFSPSFLPRLALWVLDQHIRPYMTK